MLGDILNEATVLITNIESNMNHCQNENLGNDRQFLEPTETVYMNQKINAFMDWHDMCNHTVSDAIPFAVEQVNEWYSSLEEKYTSFDI